MPKKAPESSQSTEQFQSGASVNPSRRPKMIDEERGPMEEIRALAALAPGTLRSLMTDEEASPTARLKAVEMVLDRAYGKLDSRSGGEAAKAAALGDIREEMNRLKAVPKGGQGPTRPEDSGKAAPQGRSQRCESSDGRET